MQDLTFPFAALSEDGYAVPVVSPTLCPEPDPDIPTLAEVVGIKSLKGSYLDDYAPARVLEEQRRHVEAVVCVIWIILALFMPHSVVNI